MNKNDVVNKCNQLKSFWSKRNDRFKQWYKLIQMVDELKTEKMESFVGNDPRASYNLMLHMLDCRIPHRLPPEMLSIETIEASSQIEELFDTAWANVYADYRKIGRQSWQRDLIGYLISTGWYSVFSIITQDGSRCIAEIWNPATVFPSWDDGLSECAHIFSISPEAAKRLAARNGWEIPNISKSAIIVRDLWLLDRGNEVYNTIVLGDSLVKPLTFEPRFNCIPIFTSPVGGLPDDGSISGDSTVWRAEIGQSPLVTNENIYKSWNKWWSFSMQLLRDTAQPRWFEQTASGKPILKPEDIFKRGGIFRGTPQDSIKALEVPPIPMEIRSTQLDLEAMMQRGGPSWAMYGNVQQAISTYLMSQISASAAQLTKACHQGIIGLLSDIDNFWLDQIKRFKYKPYGKSLPSKLPDDARITAEYEIRIPGDIVQRATVARMLDPDFRLSATRVMEELFPEIKNPIKENALVRADISERNPIKATIALIESLRREAAALQKAGDSRAARLYNKAADKAESSLGLEESPEVAQAVARRPRPQQTPIEQLSGIPGE